MPNDAICINDTIPHFVIFPRGGAVADGVRFVTAIYRISGPVRPNVGDWVEKRHILHSWWCSLTAEECTRMFNDGITLDRIVERMDVLQLGRS
jgi:hypothetical protein